MKTTAATMTGMTIAFIVSASLAGCSFAPLYKEPTVKAPEQYQDSLGWTPAKPNDLGDKGSWWLAYGDPRLSEFENQVTHSNENVKAAFARLQQARADTRVARADLFPNLTASGSAMRGRVSPNSPRFLAGSPTLGNDFVLEADLSYEIDLWGRVRNEVASARASQQASAADLAALDLSIRAELAMDYFNLRSKDLQQVLLDKTVDDYASALKLNQNLFDEGAAALTDVSQAQSQLDVARTQAADNRLQREQIEHAMSVLLGQNAASFKLPAMPIDSKFVPPPVDPGTPSSLLQRRPDIAEAERRVASANAQIGVAKAAYFPQFSLTGSAGYNSTNSATWFSAPSRFWSLGPQMTLPIFEGGRLVAQTDKAKAVYEEQVANYRNTVLTAYQDVEDNLVSLRELAAENDTEAAAVAASAITLRQAQYRYKEGTVTYLEVSSAETAALRSQLTAVDIQLRRISASVLLIKALGGGWQRNSPDGVSQLKTPP